MANLDLKVIFPDGNIKRLSSSVCKCPNELQVNLTNLIVGKKYTVFIENLNNTPVRTFPESYSFSADTNERTFSFFYQFI